MSTGSGTTGGSGTDSGKGHAVIDRETVLSIAKLARLGVTEAEVPGLVRDLQRIVTHFESLAEVDTEGVAETASVQLARMPLRSDRPAPSLDRDTVLAQAPRAADGGFAVPGFIDE